MYPVNALFFYVSGDLRGVDVDDLSHRRRSSFGGVLDSREVFVDIDAAAPRSSGSLHLDPRPFLHLRPRFAFSISHDFVG